MATISIAIKVNGAEKASQDFPARKVKVLLADILPDGGTPEEQGDALISHLVRLARIDANPVTIGERQYDVMLAAVSAADETWTAARVVADGMTALEAAFDALP